MERAYEPVIVAHRGLHHQFPENSLGAFCAARAAGVAWVECDVWPSGDVVPLPIVLHDETLDRTTTGGGRVWSAPWESLRGLQLRPVNGLEAPGYVPHLWDVVGAMEQWAEWAEEAGLTERPVGVLVEVKPNDCPQLVHAVLGGLCSNRVPWRLQSFDEANLIHALVHDTTAPLALLVEDRQSLDRGIANGWKDIYLRHELLDEPTARRLRDAGVSVGVWTPNTPADLRRVMDLRADVIITDEPLLAMEMVRGR